jgi:hypothetical protein
MADIRSRWQSEFAQMEIETVRDLLRQDSTLVDARVEVTMPKGNVRRWGPLFVASNHLKDLEKVVALEKPVPGWKTANWAPTGPARTTPSTGISLIGESP